MLVRIRVSMSDRPGSLGGVTSALGRAGADVKKLDVLDSESGRATDDISVEVRDDAHLARVHDALSALAGVEVEGVLVPAPPVGGHGELELVRAVLGDPARGVQTLADAAPAAAGAVWAAVLRFDTAGPVAGVMAASTAYPGMALAPVTAPLRLGPVRIVDARTGAAYGGAVVVPLGTTLLGLVLGRPQGPAFHRSEVWRLGEIGRIVGAVVPVPTG